MVQGSLHCHRKQKLYDLDTLKFGIVLKVFECVVCTVSCVTVATLKYSSSLEVTVTRLHHFSIWDIEAWKTVFFRSEKTGDVVFSNLPVPEIDFDVRLQRLEFYAQSSESLKVCS